MNIDAKTLATVAVAIVGGGGAGWGTSTVQMEVQLARQQVQIDNMRNVIVERIAEHKSDLDAVAEALNGRINRLDARKVDK